jgi:hypothetical protein
MGHRRLVRPETTWRLWVIEANRRRLWVIDANGASVPWRLWVIDAI